MIFIDIEATGLADSSYPIEIAWYNSDTQESDSFLIAPPPEWAEYWCELAEFQHQISIDELNEKGITPSEAAERLNKSLFGQTVVTDGYEWDSFWKAQLYIQAGILPTFELKPIKNYLVDADSFYEALGEQGKAHRALPDAIQIAQVFEQCK